MSLQTWVARFVVDHGQVTEEGKRLRTFERRRMDEPEVDLHILGEPAGPEAEELGAQALEAIGRFFVKENLSLTGGIRRALAGTHETLLDWNRRSLANQQISLGVTALVLSGATAFLAQAGPSLAFLRRDGKLERLAPSDEAAAPLGEGELSPELRRIDLEAGDLLIGASLALESILDADALENILARGSDEALPELYLMTRDLPTFALFAVTCFEGPEDEAEAPAPTQEQQGAPLVEPPADSPGEPALSFEPPSEPADDSTPVLVAPEPLDISKPVVRLRNDQFSPRGEYTRTTGGARPSLTLPAPRLLGLGLGAAIVVFLIFLTLPGLLSQNKEKKVTQLLQQAQTAYAASQAETDPANKRKYLEDTRLLASEAARLEPANGAAQDLGAQASNSLSALNNVIDLGPMTTITTLSKQLTGDMSIDAIAVGGGTAYLLDSRGQRVIAVSLTAAPTPSVVYETGQTYGSVTSKKPQLIVWDGNDQSGRLLVLDAERKLFEVRPGSPPNPLPVRRTNLWASVAGIETYDGNLYVLDPTGNQVQRYLPASNGFDSEPGGALSGQPNLAGINAFAVSADIYLLAADQKPSPAVRRFHNGAETSFDLGGIDRPLVAPRQLVIIPSAGELLINDAGNKRIVVAGLDGGFRRQYVSNGFTDIRAIDVDSSGSQLYVVVGDAILTAKMAR